MEDRPKNAFACRADLLNDSSPDLAPGLIAGVTAAGDDDGGIGPVPGGRARDDRPEPVVLRIRVRGPHSLEILTAAQYAALTAEDLPDQFFPYGDDLYVRHKPVPRRSARHPNGID